MPKDLVEIVRPDGTTLQVPAEDAEILRNSGQGYRDETAAEALGRNRAAAEEEYFSTAGQGLKTVGEGVASGLSLSGSDVLFEDVLGWDTAERAKYHPGKRLAGELTGAILPSIVAPGSGVGSILAKTPAGLLARGASRVAPALTASRSGQAAVRAGVEGAGYGAAAEVTQSVLNGDPLTAEAVIAGAGFGSLIGAAAGGLFGKLDEVAEGYAAARAAEKASTRGEVVAAEHYSTFHSTITDARKAAAATAKTADAEMSAAAKAARKLTPDDLVPREAVAADLFNTATAAGKVNAVAREARSEALSALKRARNAIATGNAELAEVAMKEHAERVIDFSRITGQSAPELEAIFSSKVATATDAAGELAALRSASSLRFPKTAAGFSGIAPAEMEKKLQLVDGLLKTRSAELSGVRDSVTASISNLSERVGVKVEGGPVEQLRGVWEASRNATKAASSPGVLKKVASTFGNAAASAGVKAFGGPAASALLGLKAAVMGGIQDAIATWAPKVTRAAVKTNAAARIDPLRTRIDGTIDQDSKSRREMMKARAKEIQDLAPTVRDSLYRAVTPLSTTHPKFAQAVFETGVKQFDALVAQVPKDPGVAFSRGKSLFAPDFITTEKFAQVYRAFVDPAGMVKDALAGNHVSPVAVEALKTMSPEIYQTVRLGMLERLSEPGVVEKLSYREQISLGQFIDVPIHAAATPRFIANQQMMYQQRNEPLPVSTPTSNSNNPSGGRPAGMTSAQETSER